MGSRLQSNSTAVRKRIEKHTFDDEEGEEYEASAFGGFGDYFRRKKIKLQNLDAEIRANSASNPLIFRGIVAHVNGYTQPSLNDLHRMIVSHGGGFMQYLDGKTTVTHIIASNLTPKKAVEFKRYRIVKPAWVVDSVKAGRLLPWDAYKVVDEGVGQKVLRFEDGKVTSQANVQSRGYRDQTESSWYTSQLKNAEAPPSSSGSTAFLKRRPPTPDDDEIDGLPPSHQPDAYEADERPPLKLLSGSDEELEDYDVDDVQPKMSHLDDEMVEGAPRTPPTTSPAPEDQSRSLKRAPDSDVMSPSKRAKMAAEEHNAVLLSDPRIRKSSVLNPGFLEQYYRESRLHHLSTWKADLKSQLQAMAAERSSSQKARQKRPPGSRRYIMHVDFDSFFAAVSIKKHPEFEDHPTVVAHGQGSGSEIASCNYPARKFGVKNGMWMKRALDLCPNLKVLPYDFPAYEEASRAFYEAILATDGIVQSVSIDEALVDITNQCVEVSGSDGRRPHEGSIYREQSHADEMASALRAAVKAETGCDVSVGIGGNILLAKVALRRAKPAGQHQIRPDEALDFLSALEVRDLPGVAWSIGGKLEEIGVKYVGDLRDVSREKLANTLGPKTGERLWEYARGIDRIEVGEQVIRKSVSAEVNWGVRFVTQAQVDEFIESLCGELSRRLLKERVKGRHLTMKVMRRAADAPLDPPKHLGHGKCDTYNKSTALGVATNVKEVLAREALSMLKGLGFSPGELRGIGVQMTRLEPVKAGATGTSDGSQRTLPFKAADHLGAETTTTMKSSATLKRARPDAAETDDPIQDDIVTPKKPKPNGPVAFGPAHLNTSSPSRKPLNTTGTQFILPTQVDPTVLSELPADIRSKLSRHVRPQAKPTSTPKATTSPASAAKRTAAPKISAAAAAAALPTASQLDPAILAALPNDIQDEIRAHYASTSAGRDATAAPSLPSSPTRPKPLAAQTLLPNSPRKPRPQSAGSLAPAPRRRGRPPGGGGAAAAAAAARRDPHTTTLTQSFLVPSKRGIATSAATAAQDAAAAAAAEAAFDVDIAPDFLAALPADIRREVEAQHAARRKARDAAAAEAAASHKPHRAAKGKRRKKSARPRPTFTAAKLRRVEELRAAVKAWVREFADEGPYREDVEALGAYLARVVGEERDLEKARKVVAWWGWCVDEVVGMCEGEMDDGKGGEIESAEERNKKREEWARARRRWDGAGARLKAMVQEAVRARGLGELRFE